MHKILPLNSSILMGLYDIRIYDKGWIYWSTKIYSINKARMLSNYLQYCDKQLSLPNSTYVLKNLKKGEMFK